jgi:hypothetical protein
LMASSARRAILRDFWSSTIRSLLMGCSCDECAATSRTSDRANYRAPFPSQWRAV